MSQSLTDIRTAYDLAANAYADKFLNELQHKPRDVELLKQFAKSVGTGNRVLDLGCGPGHTTAYLNSLGLKPVGVDLSPEMIAKAAELFTNVDFAVGNFFQLAEEDNSAFGILAFYCIVHLRKDQLINAFKEMFRVLKTGGVLLVGFHIGVDPVHVEDFLETGAKLEFFPFQVEEVQSNLTAVGFTNIEIHQRPPYEAEYPTNRCYIFASKQDD